jgi:hypothetical protein
MCEKHKVCNTAEEVATYLKQYKDHVFRKLKAVAQNSIEL